MLPEPIIAPETALQIPYGSPFSLSSVRGRGTAAVRSRLTQPATTKMPLLLLSQPRSQAISLLFNT